MVTTFILSHLYALQPQLEITSIDHYRQIIKDTSPTVILFYSPTCPVCISFKPTFIDAANAYSKKGKFYLLNATDGQYRDIVQQMGITEVPIVLYKEVGAKNSTQLSKRLDAFFGSPSKKNNEKKKITKESNRTALERSTNKIIKQKK